MNMALRFLCILTLLGAACGDDSEETDSGVPPDAPARVDTGNDSGPAADSGARDSGAPDAGVGPSDAGPTDARPSIDGGGFCCVPFEVADQGVCRAVEALGPGACGSVGGGGVCAWSDEAACTSEETGCCTAAMMGSEALCATLEGERCQEAAECDWSSAACSSACCSATRAGFEGMCEGLSGNQPRCESLRDCAWSDAPECTMREASCCLASREGFEGPCALRDASLEMCQSIGDCVWSTTPECATMDDEGCCVATRMGFEGVCARFESQAGCQAIRDCSWENDLLSCL